MSDQAGPITPRSLRSLGQTTPKALGMTLALAPQRLRQLLDDLGWDGVLLLLEEEASREGETELAQALNDLAFHVVTETSLLEVQEARRTDRRRV